MSLPEKMKAVVAYGVGDYRFEMVDTPHPEKGECVIQVEMCGICAGDLKAFEGAGRFWGDGNSIGYVEPPCIPGHEFSGIIVQVGEGFTERTGLAVGDRVVTEQIVPCGECRFCKEGNYWMCDPHVVYGFKNYLNGGFAEYVRLPEKAIIYPISKELSEKQAALIEPFACSLHAIDRAGIKEGDVVVIAGAGTLGLGMIAQASQYKPGKIVSLDLVRERLDLALALGADIVINPSKEDAYEIVSQLTGGYGCDVYIEATGHPSAVQQGLNMVRKMGTYVEFSVFGAPALIDWSIIGDVKEMDIKGVSLSPHAYGRVIQSIENGSLCMDGVVTHVYPLESFQEAFDTAKHDKSAIKVALKP